MRAPFRDQLSTDCQSPFGRDQLDLAVTAAASTDRAAAPRRTKPVENFGGEREGAEPCKALSISGRGYSPPLSPAVSDTPCSTALSSPLYRVRLTSPVVVRFNTSNSKVPINALAMALRSVSTRSSPLSAAWRSRVISPACCGGLIRSAAALLCVAR